MPNPYHLSPTNPWDQRPDECPHCGRLNAATYCPDCDYDS